MENLDRDQIAAEMGVKPATVAGYIIKALTIDADLPYDASRLQELIKGIIIRNDQMDALQELLAIEEAPSEAPSAAEESVSDTF